MNTPQIDHALPAHTLLKDGTYQIKKVIGAGGMGITYLGIDKQAKAFEDNQVVIKELFIAPNNEYYHCTRDPHSRHTVAPTPNLSADFDKFKENFMSEAKTLYRFRHETGMVQVKDFFEAHGTVYFTMQYIDRQTLTQYVKQRGKLTAEQALPIVQTVGNLLTKLHSENVLHRDVKPDNIMLSKSGEVYLIDFGISKEYKETEKVSKITGMGTPRYAPPEQTAGRRDLISTAMDVYGLACTMYFCLTESAPQIADEVDLEGHKTAKDLNPEVSSTWNEVIEQGRVKKTQERTREISTFLNGLTHEETIIEKKTPPRKTMPKPLTPKPPPPPKPKPQAKQSYTWVYVLVALLLLGGGVYWINEKVEDNKLAQRNNNTGSTYTDPTTGMEFVRIPAGTFTMGCTSEQGGDCYSDEKPSHRVTISSGFYMGKYEVTHRQYIAFMNAKGVNSDGSYGGKEWVHMDHSAVGYSNGSFYFKGSDCAATDDTPMIGVTWYGAVAFTEWLSELTGQDLSFAYGGGVGVCG